MSLELFHPAVQAWFRSALGEPTPAQRLAWPPIAQGESTLLLAPTGSGKTLAAFLAALDRLFAAKEPDKAERTRVLYVSPLKALAVDVDRNLRAPLEGVLSTAAARGELLRTLTVGVRSGDTPAKERARMGRAPPDILITTPESLYLLLTSGAAERLAFVDTVIVDEIHALVPSKRGAHLALSLERLESLRRGRAPLQRIGLSATQRPLEEVAQLLVGAEIDAEGRAQRRPVRILDAGRRRAMDLSVELPPLPVDANALITPPHEDGTAPGEAGSMWSAIHPRLLELVKAHRSTLIFVNSRRLSERLATALNDLAKEPLVLAHHGSLASETRRQVEVRLKQGELRALVATSSLELGIDMGAIDLVLQVEPPPSVASGLQRLGRAGHRIDAISKGVMFPRHKGELLAAAATAKAMLDGKVEETFYLRRPLDVLAQQIVASVAMASITADDLYRRVRQAAPYHELSRRSFDAVLDLLSGRFQSDRFAELRPRLSWDRASGLLEARQGARRLAVTNGGTIPDRGLFGVFLAGGDPNGPSLRVGELDEEMVFESKPGDVFLLGASSWRIESIGLDRVLVRPAPGEPGRMPFWRGDRPGRPSELGEAMGALVRRLLELPAAEARRLLISEHKLEPRAADGLLEHLAAQQKATGEVPSDQAIVLERFVDQSGDWRVCLLTPFGARVHAPWAAAITARLIEAGVVAQDDVDLVYTDDGISLRVPAGERPPSADLFFPSPREVEALVTGRLAATALFAARFRENAARALLLPRRQIGQRTPLWAQRRRAADLLAVARETPDFPIVLETMRECLADVFDLPGLIGVLERVERRTIRTLSVETPSPSPFASSLLFAYLFAFMYQGDAPAAEKRLMALALDPKELAALLGDTPIETLIDPQVLEAHVARLQQDDGRYPVAHRDALHDLLLRIGDLSRAEVERRAMEGAPIQVWVDELVARHQVLELTIGGELRLVAIEDASKLRDALGVQLPPGVPSALLAPSQDAWLELLARYARTHGPFLPDDPAQRFALDPARVAEGLEALLATGRLLEIRRGPRKRYCDPKVLDALKARTRAELRRRVAPVALEALGRFLPEWQGLLRPGRGLDGLHAAMEILEGAPLPASVLESELLPARVERYRPALLDELLSTGEWVWRGLESIGEHDGRIALYRSQREGLLAPPPRRAEGELAERLRAALNARGALFFHDLIAETQAFPSDVLGALWSMIWTGELSNDTWSPIRSRLAAAGAARDKRERHGSRAIGQRMRRALPAGAEGRWSLVLARPNPPSETERRTALVSQLLSRHGVLTREASLAEGLDGGFGAVYPVLKAMEEAGKVRRGYFVEGLGATQFAQPGAEDRLRDQRQTSATPRVLVLAATDPANAYGAALAWPERAGAHPQRAAGAQVILHDGRLAAFLGRAERNLICFPPDDPAQAPAYADALAEGLRLILDRGGRRALWLSQVDGQPAKDSALAPQLVARGFSLHSRGLFLRGSVKATASD